MKKIYLILAHAKPKQIERQINRLNDEHSFFYVHIDLKSNIELFENLRKINNANICLIKEREDCIWGDFTIVTATLNLIENALKNHSEGLCILLSGDCYPIKSNSFINNYITVNKDKNFIDIEEAEKHWPTFYKRVKYYNVKISSRKGHYLVLKPILNPYTFYHFLRGHIPYKKFMTILFKKRKLNLDIKFYGYNQWWAINIPTLKLIMNYIEENKNDLYSFFSDSLAPDEFFFQSIIMHLKNNGSPINIDSSLTYTNWERKNCLLPVTFEINDYEELITQPSNKLFARKLNIEKDVMIFEKLDENS